MMRPAAARHRPAIRSLISRVVLTPVEGQQLEVRLYGDLVEIVAFSERGERKEKRPRLG
jgi:hypothetical protein